MNRLLGAAVAAIALAVSGSAAAQTATFYSLGSEPIIQYDYTPILHGRVGGVSVDTISPPSVTNINFQWHRSGLPPIERYDFMSAFEAWGELPAILWIDVNTALNTSGYEGRGSFSIIYNGADITANGATYTAGDRLLYGGLTFEDGYIWTYAQSDFAGVTEPAPDLFEFTLLNAQQNGYIVTAGLQGAFFAGIPEPTTWAMMLIGFAGAGTMVRRARSQKRVAVAV